MTEQESLILIREMIERARGDVRQGGYFFLLWGWLVVAGCAIHYGLWDIVGPAQGAFTWAAVGLIGGVGTWIEIRKQKLSQRRKSLGGKGLSVVWTAVGALLLILTGLGLAGAMTFHEIYPMYMFLYGIGTFITGGIISFRPLQIGALISWGLGIGAFYVDVKEQLLFIGLAIIVSYLIPGYLLNRSD